MRDFIKAKALELGFDLVGICSAEPFVELAPVLEHRNRSSFRARGAPGSHNPQRCIQVESVLPGARSIVAVAISYAGDTAHPYDDACAGGANSSILEHQLGYVARYTRGLDYHRILNRKLQQLSDAIIAESGGRARTAVLCDTGPLLDRQVAQRAGLGYYGKNCTLINPEFGSWLFLGELITDLPLAGSHGDHPFPGPDICGDCNACIQACPTGAIVEPYVIDANRCLSYVTQVRGSIPARFRTVMGGRVMGCDTCQAVCLFNHRATGPEHSLFIPVGPKYPSLVKLLQMSRTEYAGTYGQTASGWRGRNILQRNAAICLANIGDRQARAVLTQLARSHPSPVVREHCPGSSN